MSAIGIIIVLLIIFLFFTGHVFLGLAVLIGAWYFSGHEEQTPVYIVSAPQVMAKSA